MKSNYKRQLVVFNQHTSYLTIDIINSIIKRKLYDDIVLVTGVINEREDCLSEVVRVYRTIPYKKGNLLSRLSSWVLAFVKFVFVVKVRCRGADILLVTNPPLISFFPYFCKCRHYSVIVFDVYPDALTAGGFVDEKSVLYKTWSKANRRMYSGAKHIYTISEGMKERLSQYQKADRIELVQLWSSYAPKIIERLENIFLKENGLEDSFVVMYSGNMGKGCGLECIVDLASELKDYSAIVFLFVGDGWSVPMLKDKVERMNLNNCRFMPYQEASILRYSLSAADVAVVSLPSATGSISIPNKLYTLIALGRPLLCLTPADTDLAKVVNSYEMGQCFDTDNIDGMKNYLLRMYKDHDYKSKYMLNAVNASKDFTKENANRIKIL